MTNTIVSFNGKSYQLVRDAYVSGSRYEAPAIDISDMPDEDGCVPAYSLHWSVPPTAFGQSDAAMRGLIDWNAPFEVLPIGDASARYYYSFVGDRIC